jgi:ABC-2 type transport system ATP-binding protein
MVIGVGERNARSQPVNSSAASLAVQAVDLTKSYGKVNALNDCTFELPMGSFTALVGPNGAGKTTLLMLLVGLLSATHGRVKICGYDPARDRRTVVSLIGYVSQDRPLYPSLSVAETLEMGRRLSTRWNKELALERIERLEIPLRATVGKLSGGQQAQVSLTLALGKEPSVLILDEPMASLDPIARHGFLTEVVESYSRRSMAVLMSSHVLAELGRVSDHIAILQRGRLLVAGPVSEIVDRSRLSEVSDAKGNLSGVTELERIVLSYLGS